MAPESAIHGQFSVKSYVFGLETVNNSSQPDKWLKPAIIRTLSQLDSCTEVGVYLTRATTWTIDSKSTWNYAGCGSKDCSKGVPRYWVIGDVCSKCNNRIDSIVPRFKVRIQVVDQFDNAVYFTMFDKTVASILQKSAVMVLSDNNLEDFYSWSFVATNSLIPRSPEKMETPTPPNGLCSLQSNRCKPVRNNAGNDVQHAVVFCPALYCLV